MPSAPPPLRGLPLRVLAFCARTPGLSRLIAGPLSASLGLPAVTSVKLPGAGDPKPYIRTNPITRERA